MKDWPFRARAIECSLPTNLVILRVIPLKYSSYFFPHPFPFNNFRSHHNVCRPKPKLLKPTFTHLHPSFPVSPSAILSDPPSILYPHTSVVFMVPVIASFSTPLHALPVLFYPAWVNLLSYISTRIFSSAFLSSPPSALPDVRIPFLCSLSF